MPLCHHHYGPGQLQFITSSTYRRLPIFLSLDHRPLFVQSLRAARAKFHFALQRRAGGTSAVPGQIRTIPDGREACTYDRTVVA